MAGIKPFKGVHYNLEKVKDMAKVVCPPYDVISAEEQIFYHTLSPHNFIHIDLTREKPDDDKSHNKYHRAKKTFEEWLSKEVLVQDDKPSIYFYKQEYKVHGEKHSRLGFIGLMELEDEGDSRVYPHENTHAHAVEDRLKLTQSLNANLSSIFVCFSDKQRKVENIFNKQVISEKPLFDVLDNDGVRHKLWHYSDLDQIREINHAMADQHFFIADGHHRFKVAMEYRQLRLDRKKNVSGTEPYNYVMTYFTNIDSKDLLILPMHRIIKHLQHDLGFLEEYFRIDKIKSKEDMVILLAKAGVNEHAFGLYTREGVRLIRLKNKSLIQDFVKEGSLDYKSLDATILKYFVLDKLGIASSDIIYSKDYQEATSMVDEGKADASFILNPVKISQLKAIALNGEKMPPKTTYFYPKVLSGLTVYKMV